MEAVCDHIEKTLKENNICVLDREGLKRKQWALVGTGDVIIHIFHHKAREFYNLEGLWSDFPRITVGDESAPS